MIFVTYYKYWLKCYLNVFTTLMIVPKRMGSTNVLANAIDKFNLFFNDEKKLNQFYKSNFSTVTFPVSSITHLTLSPGSMFKWSTISFGIPHLNELFWRLA